MLTARKHLLRTAALIAFSAGRILWPMPTIAEGGEADGGGCYDVDTLLLLTTVEAHAQGMNAHLANRVWWLESRGNLLAEGEHGELGPWQIKPTTWTWLAGKWEQAHPDDGVFPYAPHDPYWSTKLAVWAMVNGYEAHWTTFPQALADDDLMPIILRECIDWLEQTVCKEALP